MVACCIGANSYSAGVTGFFRVVVRVLALGRCAGGAVDVVSAGVDSGVLSTGAFGAFGVFRAVSALSAVPAAPAAPAAAAGGLLVLGRAVFRVLV